MNTNDKVQFEQVSLEFIIENSYKNFEKSISSVKTKIFLINGFVDKDSAIKAALKRRKPQIDRRKKLSDVDENYISLLEEYAADAEEYISWVRSENGVPLYKDALVSYCTAFENCLKSIALAFFLAENELDANLSAQIIIPSEKLTRARREITKQWDEKYQGDLPKVQNFFELTILGKRAANKYSNLTDGSVSEVDWQICSAAFQLRNIIVHNLGFINKQIDLGERSFHPAWPIELDKLDDALVRNTFLKILSPFLIYILGLDLGS